MRVNQQLGHSLSLSQGPSGDPGPPGEDGEIGRAGKPGTDVSCTLISFTAASNPMAYTWAVHALHVLVLHVYVCIVIVAAHCSVVEW